jgi:outer membrane immunogenic protein
MKKLILIIALGFISNGVFAQAPLEEGRTQLNAGIGISNSDWGIPVYFGLDYGIAKDWTLGGQLSFQTNNQPYYNNNNTYNYNSSVIGIGANGNYHFNRILEMPSKFDFYAGANLTAFIWNYDNNDYHNNHDAVGLGLQVGGRYFFTDKFGINLELGGNTGTSNGAKFGVTFKL